MKEILLLLAVVAYVAAPAQNIDAIINAKEVERIERVLSADDMQGRRPGTPGSNKAAAFIADEFKKAGLQPVAGNSYLQTFTVVRPKPVSAKGIIDNKELDAQSLIVVTSQAQVNITEKSGYAVHHIKGTDNLNAVIQPLIAAKKNAIVFIDTAFTKNFARLNNLKRQMFKGDHSLVFVLGSYAPTTYAFAAQHEIEEVQFANVVGVLPGKGKKSEQVIFSAHYDHLGIGKPVNGDSIYNGANDDAAGTTAVIMLAHYFKKLNNNERTLIFAAFTAEESGGFGSQYFSQQYNPKGVMAMFNIEMIGTESKWGPNTAFITGYEKTNMGEILQKNLQGSSFTFHPDPYPDLQLFYRSDNATLARLGVPAHTISTSKMDAEPHYHTVDDEIETLNMENMAQIIKAIAASSKSIVAGKDTPTRVNVESLR